jgi:hypothetical protein
VSDEGAWFATAPDGAPVVLKWFPDETVADRYAVLLPGLDQLRSRGVPVPEYPRVLAVEGWTLSAQQVLPGPRAGGRFDGCQRTRVRTTPKMTKLGAVWVMRPIQVLWKRRVG